MRLTEQAAMGVDRIAATQLNLAIGYEFGLCSRFAIPHRFQLQQNDIGKAVVDLQEIHVLALDARHVESARGSIAEANLERSEEHTSELQSLMRISYAVFCLKKKKQITRNTNFTTILT